MCERLLWVGVRLAVRLGLPARARCARTQATRLWRWRHCRCRPPGLRRVAAWVAWGCRQGCRRGRGHRSIP